MLFFQLLNSIEYNAQNNKGQTDHLGERIFIASIEAKTNIKIQTKVVIKAN